MSENAEGAGFWLPSEFFDDFQVDKENSDKNNTESDSEFCFPNEFPYDFGTKTDQLLEKRWLMSTSPQSTLSHISGRSAGGSSNGSPNGFPSPPTTPRNDSVEELIYLAAGQVARLKLHGGDVAGPTKPKGLMAPPRSLRDPSVIPNIYLQQQQIVKQQKQRCEMWQQMYQMRMGQDAWPVQQNPTRMVGSGGRAAVFGTGGGVAAAKRGCAGTGVFLPRRYGDNNNNNNECNAYFSDSRKRPGYTAPSIPIPNRNVHAMNKNMENLNGFAQSQPHFQPKLGRGFNPECDLLMARRNALLLQHQQSILLDGSSPMNRGVFLPHEWTY